MEELIKVYSIESTLSGEGKFTGYPTTIVRLYGCPLKCSYCDTHMKKGIDLRKLGKGVGKITNIVRRLGNRYVLITGGEPLIQPAIFSLIYTLASEYYKVWIETSGAVPIDADVYRRSWSYCMDIKCPSSEMAGHNIYSNLANLHENDECKFVISDYADYMFARGVLKQYPTNAQIIFSPMFNAKGKHNGKELASWILQDGLTNVRLGLQIHKILGVP